MQPIVDIYSIRNVNNFGKVDSKKAGNKSLPFTIIEINERGGGLQKIANQQPQQKANDPNDGQLRRISAVFCPKNLFDNRLFHILHHGFFYWFFHDLLNDLHHRLFDNLFNGFHRF